MSMQTLTWDVDAAAVAAVAGNSDAYGLALATQARQNWDPQFSFDYIICHDIKYIVLRYKFSSTGGISGVPPSA